MFMYVKLIAYLYMYACVYVCVRAQYPNALTHQVRYDVQASILYVLLPHPIY